VYGKYKRRSQGLIVSGISSEREGVVVIARRSTTTSPNTQGSRLLFQKRRHSNAALLRLWYTKSAFHTPIATHRIGGANQINESAPVPPWGDDGVVHIYKIPPSLSPISRREDSKPAKSAKERINTR